MIDSSHLSVMQGRDLLALEFRRHAFPEAFTSGQATLQVVLSVSPHPAAQVSDVFAANVGVGAVTVFQGVVVIPASPAPSAGLGIWDPQNVVRIPFQVPFPYTGGNLCVDITGVPGPNAVAQGWTGDAVRAPADSAVADLGPGTGSTANSSGDWLFLDPNELVAGGRAKLVAYGPSNGVVIGFVGRPAPQPIPLSLVGIATPGAHAYLDELYLSTFALLLPPVVPVTSAGVATWDVALPSEPWMLGVSLAAQFLELTQSDVSNGLQWTVGTTFPALGMAQVFGVASEPAGERAVNVAPILRFEYTTP